MSDENKLMSALDRIEANMADFRKSNEAELKAAKEGTAKVEADLAEIRKQVQDVAAVAKQMKTMPHGQREVYRAWGEVILKAASEGTDASGGYSVNDQLMTEILSGGQNSYGLVQNECTIIPMASDVTKVAVDTFEESGTVPVPGVTSENAQITATDDATISQVSLTALKYATLNYISAELMQDGFVDWIGGYMLPKMLRQEAKKKDSLVFTTASTGVLASTNMSVVNMDAGDVSFADLLDPAKAVKYLTEMQDAVVSDALANAKYFAHRSIINSLRSVRGSDSYLWAPMAAGEPGSILGYSYVKGEILPAKTATASAKGFVIFGDLRNGVVVGERGQRKVSVSEHFKFDYDQLAVRMTFRFAYNTNSNLGKAVAVLKTAGA